jgi:Transposase DDE domain group 1
LRLGNLKSFLVLSTLLACQASANHKRPPGSARLAGALLLGATDRTTGLVRRFAGCFRDGRDAASIEHSLSTLVGQRLFAIALGYEDLNDS